MRNVTVGSPALLRTETISAATHAELTYLEDDPYAVTLVVEGAGQWLFARDLLADCFTGPVGEGDVYLGHDGDNVHVCLSAADRWALVQVPAPAVRQFLAASYGLVARGAEHVDVEGLLTQLTAPQ